MTTRKIFVQKNPTYNHNEHRWGDQSSRIIDYLVRAGEKINPPQIEAHELVSIYVKYVFLCDVKRPIYGFTLKTLDGVDVFGSNSEIEDVTVASRSKGERAVFRFDLPSSLISGEYFINIGLAEYKGGDTVPLDRRYDLIHLKIYNSTSRYGIVDFQMQILELF